MLFSFLHKININKGVEEFRKTSDALLLDVRTKEEYKEFHIPDSINIPVDSLENIKSVNADKKTPIFVHCLSGGRSARAAAMLRNLGYDNVTDIGGIISYNGKTVKG